MKTYENKRELINAMLDMDVEKIYDMVLDGLDDTDNLDTTFAKMACNIAKGLVENAGGEAQFDVDAIVNDEELDNIIGRIAELVSDISELVVAHGEITGIEVLGE